MLQRRYHLHTAHTLTNPGSCTCQAHTRCMFRRRWFLSNTPGCTHNRIATCFVVVNSSLLGRVGMYWCLHPVQRRTRFGYNRCKPDVPAYPCMCLRRTVHRTRRHHLQTHSHSLCFRCSLVHPPVNWSVCDMLHRTCLCRCTLYCIHNRPYRRSLSTLLCLCFQGTSRTHRRPPRH